jgi:hypothetical protein
MDSAGKERGNGIRRRPAGGAKRLENARKILNRGNEPKDVLQTQDLAFLGAQNEPNFECKKEPIEAKKRVLAPGFYVIGGGG